jgi:co-chaperonin GroES (HSP10)
LWHTNVSTGYDNDNKGISMKKSTVVRIPNDMVAIQPLYDSDYYSKDSRIYRPDSAKERCDQGIVKYIGRNVPKEDILPGDHVFFKGWTGVLVSLEGEGDLIFMPYDYIDFKLENVPTTEVHGLYFRDNEGEYFPATYEMAVVLMRDAIVYSEWFRGIKFKKDITKRTLDEIERKRGRNVWGEKNAED